VGTALQFGVTIVKIDSVGTALQFGVTIVTMETQQYVSSYCCWTPATVNRIKVFIVAIEMSHGFSLHCCRATKYVVLPLTIKTIKYSECVFVFLCRLCGMQIASVLRCGIQDDRKVSVHLMITIQSISCITTSLNVIACQPTARARGTLDSH
jgi:hypothetical protein